MNGNAHRKIRFGAVAVSLAIALAGCGGHGSTAIPGNFVTKPSVPIGQAVFTMHWPSKTAAKGLRHRDFVSPSALSVSIDVNNDQQLAQVTNKPANGGFSTVNIDAPLGTDTFLIKTFDEPDGQGNVLGQTQLSQGIQPNVLNTIGATIDGICTQIGLNFVPTNPNYAETENVYGQPVNVLVGTLPQQIVANAEDMYGNVIVAPGFVPPVSMSQDGGSALQVVPTGNNTFAVSAISAMPDGAAESVSGSSQHCVTTGPTPLPSGATTGASLAIATKAAFVFPESMSGMAVTDQDGNVITTTNSFPGSGECYATTFDSTNNYIYSNCSNPQGVFAWDLNGNAQTLTGSFTPGSGFSDLQYVAANDRFYGALGSNGVKEYDPEGDDVTPPNSFQDLTSPAGIAYGLNNLYIVDYTGNELGGAISVFSLTGASISSSLSLDGGTLNGGRIAYDPVASAVYVYTYQVHQFVSGYSVLDGSRLISFEINELPHSVGIASDSTGYLHFMTFGIMNETDVLGNTIATWAAPLSVQRGYFTIVP